MRAIESRDRITSLARPEVLSLPVYDAGISDASVRDRYAVAHVARLATNENPLGASARVIRVLSEASAYTALYPDSTCLALRREIAARTNVPPARIAMGNGSENLLEALCQAFVRDEDIVVTPCPCFGLHEIYPRMMGAQVRKVPVDAALGFNIDSWEKALSAPHKMVMLSNPSNPVGCILDRETLPRLLRAADPDALLVVDEAYYEYAALNPAYPDVLRELENYSGPWVVLRTFSKAFGLAGLRVGYALASDERIVELIDRVRTPYNVNAFAQEAAIAGLQDTQHVAAGVALVTRERARLGHLLRSDGFTVAPSDANFLFIDARSDSLSVARQLLQHGVVVKPWRESGFGNFIRVSIGTAENNDLFMTALRACVPG